MVCKKVIYYDEPTGREYVWNLSLVGAHRQVHTGSLPGTRKYIYIYQLSLNTSKFIDPVA